MVVNNSSQLLASEKIQVSDKLLMATKNEFLSQCFMWHSVVISLYLFN